MFRTCLPVAEKIRANAVRPRLVCVIPSLQPGGMERVMATLLEHFDREGCFRLDLVLYGRGRQVFFPLPDSVVVHQPGFDFDRFPRWVSTALTALFIRRTIRRLRPDHVLSFGEIWNSFVLLSLIGLRKHISISDRCQPTKRLSKHHEILRSWLYPHADQIIVQTGLAGEYYHAQFHRSAISVIGNPIACPSNVGSETRERVILNVARLIDTKHHDRLLRMFASLHAPEWRLVILGDDAQAQSNRTRLLQLVDDLGISDRVTIAGTVKDVTQHYLSASVFAFPSSSEGFPNALAEAMAHGLPCVSYDCCAGPSDLIRDGIDGYLVPVFDDELFAQRLQALVDNTKLRGQLGSAAHESMARFSAPRIAARYAEVITGRAHHTDTSI